MENNIKEKFKDIEIEGRKFRIENFSAETGCYLAYVIAERMSSQSGKDVKDVVKLMPKSDFRLILKDALSAVKEYKPAETVSIIDVNGNWAVEGIENDFKLVLSLALGAISFNLRDFFTGNGLSEVMTMFQG